MARVASPFLILPMLLSSAVAAAAPAKVIVLDLRGPAGPAAAAAAALNALLPAEVGRASGVAAVTQSDLRSLLAVEAMAQLLGCEGDAACAASRLATVGPSKLVSGEVQALESTFLVTLALIDVEGGRVERRVSRSREGGAAGLIPELRSAVEELLAGYGFKANVAPVANAKAVGTAAAEEPLGLDASGSYDPDGQPLTYRWRQLAGPAARLDQPAQAVTDAVLPEGGRYRFAVTVSDGHLESPEALVEVVARAAPKLQLELGAAGLFGLPVLVEGDARPYRERVLQHYELTLAVPVARGTSVAFGGSLQTLTTFPDAGARDAEVMFVGLLARVGVRRLWTFDALRAGVGADLLMTRGYLEATVTRGGPARVDGWHRALLAGAGAHLFVEVPLPAALAIYGRAGVRWERTLGEVPAFDPAFVPVALTRSAGAFQLPGADLGAGLSRAW